MIKEGEIQYFQEQLLQWYSLNGRTFPWRKKKLSQYQIIIAEVLLQRTKAETVSKFYHTFLKTFPSWTSLSNAGIEEIAEQLKPVGLQHQRAKRLHALAEEMKKRSGKLPRNRVELEQIPFLGSTSPIRLS